MIKKFLRFFHTVRYIRPRQLLYYVVRRGTTRRIAKSSATPKVRFAKLVADPCRVSGIFRDDTTFRFLNSELKLGSDVANLTWMPSSAQRLWQFNLHYFDFLREANRPLGNKNSLIESWIASNTNSSASSWEPFTCSLRIVNWTFFFLQRTRRETPAVWLASLYDQASWLERNLEKDILANHYFENLKALLFASCVFTGAKADKWRSISVSELVTQLAEQTLPDGGHYERSPMYHCLMVENYLDICNIARSYSDLFPDEFVESVKSAVLEGLDWLADVLFPGNTIPLFNDSAFGVAPDADTLFQYAEKLLDYSRPVRKPEFQIVEKNESGLYGAVAGNDMILFDCGDIGPSYQPGHTHCDFLSFELMLCNQSIIVDSGVFEYEAGEMREYVRSTRAHNTVSIDGAEQSDVWGAFRVGRRAKKLNVTLNATDDGALFFGSFRGFFSIGRSIEHRRRATIEASDNHHAIRRVLIEDYIIGEGHRAVESYIHVHPDIDVIDMGDGILDLVQDQKRIAVICVPDSQDYAIDTTFYCPEFGVRVSNYVVVVRKQGGLPMALEYEIRNLCEPVAV